jgi:hypothetical protein
MATPRLPDSPSRRVSDSPTRQVGESAFECLKEKLGESKSWRLPDSANRGVESFFDYEYLREFEAKSGTAPKVV